MSITLSDQSIYQRYLPLSVALLAALSGVKNSSDLPQRTPPVHVAGGLYGRLPLSFEPNHGQAPEPVRFLARGRGYVLGLTDTEAILTLHGVPHRADAWMPAPTAHHATLHMRIVGGNPRPCIEGLDALPGKTHYFLGKTPTLWRTNIPTYAKVKYAQVYPGIDLVYYGIQAGQLEYDFIIHPGAHPETVALRFEGDETIDIDPQGSLVLSTAIGQLRQPKPFVYQEVDGIKQPLSGHYVRKGATEVGFQVARYDRSKPLVIDPLLIYSTYLGGTQDDWGQLIAVDRAGSAYVAGQTNSLDFPLQHPIQGADGGGGLDDAFVTKLTPDGTALVYSTYLGGNGEEYSKGIALDTAGHAYVTGHTGSTNFPTSNPFDPTLGGFYDAFVTKLSPSGSALVYSTYLGGTVTASGLRAVNPGSGIAVDLAGRPYVTGQTNAVDFPLEHVFQSTPPGVSTAHAFATKLEALPVGVLRYGVSTPSCLGPMMLGITDTPAVGNQRVALTLANAPPHSAGLLLVSLGQDLSGTPIGRAAVFVDLAQLMFKSSLASDQTGTVLISLPLRLLLKRAKRTGGRVFVQSVWLNTDGCQGAGALSASDALDLTIQPRAKRTGR